jgi:predicted RNase H-like nuclease (RuvC/YqgF family)
MKNTRNNNQKRRQSSDSFLEAFRDLGADLVSTASDNLKDGLDDIKKSILSSDSHTSSYSDENSLYQREAELEKQFQARLRQKESIQRQEQVLYTRKEKETQEQVKALQSDIQELAKSVNNLASGVQQAERITLQETPVVGVYHLNFFVHLRKIIADLRTQIQESAIWLEAWNTKAKKKNHYWGNVKKSGSKFLLSQDRYMATQAG